MADYLLAIDQGTTSTRAIVFDAALEAGCEPRSRNSRQIYPAPGQVEHDPEEIWATTVATVREAMAKAALTARDIAAIGITNQRETTRHLGSRHRQADPQRHRLAGPAHRRCLRRAARKRPRAADRRPRTGLLLDPYFSATKIAWLLDHVDGARAAAEPGKLAFGTIDSFLLWRLTGGKVHATDATNAARTLLLDIWRRRVGRGPVPAVRRAGGAAAAGARLRRRLRHDGAGAVRRRRSAFSAWPATSRRRRSGRAASAPA